MTWCRRCEGDGKRATLFQTALAEGVKGGLDDILWPDVDCVGLARRVRRGQGVK